MKKFLTLSALALSITASVVTVSVKADEIGTAQITLTRGGHGGHGGHISGHGGHAGGHGGHISGHGSHGNHTGGHGLFGGFGKHSSGHGKHSSGHDSHIGKHGFKSPKLSKDESSAYNKGSKVDDKTMKKFAQQEDKVKKSSVLDIFDKNNARTEYHSYRNQSIISNPWFWLFITTRNHHRYNDSAYNENMTNKDYLAGYKAGFKDGQSKKDNTNKLSKSKSKKFMNGYKDGLEDAKK